MTCRTKKTTTFTTLAAIAVAIIAAALLLAPPGLTSAQMIPGAGDVEETTTAEPYALSDIGHAFTTMEPYVVYGENKTISFDVDAAERDPHVSRLDVQIAQDFAKHNNAIMEAAVTTTGPVGQVTR